MPCGSVRFSLIVASLVQPENVERINSVLTLVMPCGISIDDASVIDEHPWNVRDMKYVDTDPVMPDGIFSALMSLNDVQP